MIEGQQIVIGETSGRRKRRREVNRKLKNETVHPGKNMQPAQGQGELSEEKSDPKEPATLRVKELLCLDLEGA